MACHHARDSAEVEFQQKPRKYQLECSRARNSAEQVQWLSAFFVTIRHFGDGSEQPHFDDNHTAQRLAYCSDQSVLHATKAGRGREREPVCEGNGAVGVVQQDLVVCRPSIFNHDASS